ncbi:LOW QUALITY PROTEIN: mucin-16-like [Oryza brachyantha]|uniref:LOW QUALITY PROTEIN: mucin-16-like n=1 Tax=Oryza brachyantha TaxID=4533 RepID=UPI001ADC5D5D|nr:LOW QUALITY PROTEIN: mucin-16-like [Oryza brachyantha]
MAGLGTGAPIVKVYHEKSLILPDVSRVLACLYEKDVKFETHTASYKSLLRLQASTHAPVPFYDGPTFLEESREICRYVAETYEHHGYPFLLGKDALERASIEQWLHHEEHTFNPASRALFCHLAFPLDREDDDIEMQKAKLEEILEVYEQRLSDSEFLAGNKFTLADLVHLPNSHYITASSKFVYLYDSRKNVQRWWNDISTRASWKQVLSYMTRVEQQHKLEEFEKQKQQEWQREHRTAAGGRTRLYSQKHTITGTRSQTILVPPPPGTVSPSPIAPQADQPPPADSLSEKASVSSSQSTTTHKSLTSPNKQTTIFNTHQETPPDLDQSTQITNTSSTPSLGTFHTAPDKPPRIHADMSSIRDVSVPSDATETDLPTRPYIEPTPQKPPALLDTHSQTSLAATKEDSDQLNASDLYKSDRKSTGVYSEEKESISYTAHTFEGTYGKSTTQGATDSFPSNLHSTEHQMLQSKQWHAATSGLRNLQGDIDSMPSRQVKPSKDVQQYPPQDSEQASIRPVAQEPKSRKDKLVRGPEIIAQTPHTYQTRDASLQPRDAADARISENETSFDRRKKGADWPKHSTEEDAQATPFQTTYDDSQGATQRARETSFVPRRTMDQDVHDTSQVIRTYGSAPSRLQPKDASQDVPLSSKKAPSKVPHTTTHVSTGYQGAQEFIQGSETPKQRRMEVQDSLEETKAGEYAMPREQPSKDLQEATPPLRQAEAKDIRHTVPSFQKQETADSHSTTTPFQRRYPEVEDTSKELTHKPKETGAGVAQHDFEETKALDSATFGGRAQPQDTQRAAITPPKQATANNVLSATPLSPTRYPTAEDSGRQPRRTASTSSGKAVQDGRDKEPKSVDFTSSREQPSDVRRTAASFQKQESADSRSTTTPFQRKYPDVEDTTKKPRDKPKETVGEDSRGISEEIQALDSTLFGGRARPKDTHQTAITPSHQAAAKDAPDVTPFSPTRYPAAEVINRQLRRTASTPTEKEVQDGRDAFIEPISVDSTSSKEQPSDVRGVFSSLPKDEAGDSRRKTMPFQQGYPDIDDTTKEPRDKPKETGVEVAQYGFKEAKALDSTLFRGRAQPEDTQQAAITPSQQAAITPSQQAAANDALSVTPLYPTRYPAAEDSSRQPRRTTSTPTEKTVQDGRDAMRDPRSVDSTSSREQPSDFRQTGASFQKQEAADSHSTIMPFQRRYPDVEDTTKEPRDKPKKTVGEDSEETQALDSTLFIGRAKPKDTQETAITPSQQAATKDALSVTPLSPTRYPAAEDTSMQPRRIASTPTEKVVQDGRDASIESTSVDSTSSQEQPSDVRRASASLSNQEAADSRRTSMPFQRRYPDIDNTTKKLRDKPKETMDDDAQDVSEETKVIDSTLFRGSAQPQDTQQVATTPSQQAAATDSLSVTPLSPTRYPNAEDNSRQPRRTTSTPTEKAVQDGRYTFRELMSVDSTSSREQPSDVRQADASFQKQEAANSRSTTMPFLRRYRDIDDTKEPRDKPKETVGQDVEDTIEESNTADSLLFATQPSDMPQAALTPSKKVTPEDAPTVSPPLPTRYPSVEDTRKQSMGTTTLEAPQDIREPKAVDSTSSPGPSDPLRASASLPKQEVDDAHRTTTPFQKIDPELKNTTKPVKDNISTSWEMTAQDAKDAFKETKIPDSAAPSMSEMDSSRTDAEAQAEAQDTWDGGRQSRGTWDKGMQRRETISARKEMVAKDAEDMSAETKTGDFSSIRQSPELLQASSQSRQVVPDNARGATKGPKVSFTNETIQSPDVKDTTRESRVASEEIIGPASTLDRVESFGSHDTQHTNEGSRIPSADEREDVSTQFQSDAQDVLKELKSSFTDQRGMDSSHSQAESGKDTLATKGGKTFSTEKLREMPIESEASGPTGQRTDSGYPSVEGSQQARTLPAGGKVDYSTPKHQPPPGSPSASHEKPASAPPRERFRDDYSTEYPMKKDTIDDQKEVPPLSSQGPTSQVQHASQTSQKEAPDNGVSTIDQWRLAPRTMKDVTPISGDDVTGLSSDDQIPPPMGQETIPSIQDANEPTDVLDKTKKTKPTSTDQEGMAPTAGLGSTLESQLGGTLAAEVVHTDQKSTLADRESARATQPLSSVEPIKDHAADQPVVPQPIFYQQARTSPSITRRAQTLDNLGAISKIQEVSLHSQPVDYSAVSHVSTEEQVPRAPPPSASLKSVPAEDIHADANGKVQTMKPSATPDAPHVTTPAEVALSEQKLALAGQDSSQSTQLPSPDEPRSQENDAELTQAQPTPESPPDLSSQYGVPTDVLDKTEKTKLTPTDQEGVAPTAGPGSTLESQLGGTLAAEVVHTDQKSTLPDHESARATQPLPSIELTKEDTNVSTADQPVVPQTFFYQQARTSPPITRQAQTSDNLGAISKIQEVSPDSQPGDYSTVSPISTEEQVPRAPPPSASLISTPAEDISTDTNGKVQATKPSATPDGPHVTTPGEVALSKQKLTPAGQDSSQSTQLPSPDEPRSQENDAEFTQVQPTPQSPPDLSSQYGVPTNVLDKTEKIKPTTTDQEGVSPTAGPGSTLETQLGGTLAAEVVHTDQKSTLPDRESAHATQALSFVEPTKEDTNVSAVDQPVVPQTIFYQQARTSPSITRQAHTSDNLDAIGKIEEVSPDSQPADYSAVSPILTEEQVPRAPPPSASVKSVHTEDIRADANGKVQTTKPSATPDAPHVTTPAEVALSEQKLALAGEDSSQSTQLHLPDEPRSQENDAELTQAQPTPESPPDLSSQYGVPADVLDKIEKTKPTSTDQEGMTPTAGPRSTLESQLGGMLAAEVVHTDQKSTLPDRESARATQPLSSVEPTKDDAADQPVVPQPIFYQQARTSPSITRQAQTSDNLGAITKIQEVYPDSQPANYSAVSPVLTEEQVPRAPPPSASVKSVPAEDVSTDTNGKVETLKPSATPDAPHVMTPGEVALSKQKLAPGGQDSSQSTQLPSPNEPRSQENDAELTQTQPTPESPPDLSSQYGVPTDVLDKTEKTKPASIDQEGVAPTVPDPTQINSDILPTSGYGPTSSPNNQETQPLAGAQAPPTMDSSFSTFVQNRPANSLQNFDSSMPSATDEAVKAPMVNPTPTTDAPQGKDLAQSTQLPPSTESSQKVSKVVKDDQTIVSEPYTIQDTISSSVGSRGPSSSDSTYPTVKKQEFDPDAVKPSLPMTATPGDIQPSSPKEYMEVTEEISKQQQQTDQSSTESSKDENKPNGVSTSISTTTGDMHPSPPKESMESTEEARNQQKAQDSKEQVKDTEEQNTGTGEPEKSNLPQKHESDEQRNISRRSFRSIRKTSFRGSATRQRCFQINKGYIKGSIMTPEEYMRDLQAKGNTQDEEIETAISEKEQPKARDSQANTNGIISSQSEVQASEISERQTSSLEDMNRNSKETGGYLLATTSSNNKEAQPPAGTPTPSIEGSSSSTFLQDVPDNSLPNFDLPRSSTTDEAVKPPMLLSPGPAPEASPGTASFPAPAPDAPQDKDLTQSTQLPPSIQSSQKVSKVVKDDQTIGSQSSTVQDTILSSTVSGGSSSSDSTSPTGQNQEFDPDAVKPSLSTIDMDSVHPPREASLDFSSNEKTTSQGSQANNLPNISLSVSASQLVDQSENGAATGAPSAELVPSNSQENSQGMPIKEISKQQQQTDQSSTKSSKDDNKETNGGNAGISTKPKDIQPSPPKESMEITEEARNQQKSQDSMKQIEDVDEQNTGTGEPDKSNLGKNMNEKNNGISQDQALSQSGKPASGVELLGNAVPKSTKDTSSGIQTYDKSENSLMSSEEHTLDLQAKGNNTQGGEMETQTLETEQPKESDPQTNSNGIINNQSQAQASDIPEGQASSTEDLKGNSRETDSSTNDTKPGGTEDNTS